MGRSLVFFKPIEVSVTIRTERRIMSIEYFGDLLPRQEVLDVSSKYNSNIDAIIDLMLHNPIDAQATGIEIQLTVNDDDKLISIMASDNGVGIQDHTLLLPTKSAKSKGVSDSGDANVVGMFGQGTSCAPNYLGTKVTFVSNMVNQPIWSAEKDFSEFANPMCNVNRFDTEKVHWTLKTNGDVDDATKTERKEALARIMTNLGIDSELQGKLSRQKGTTVKVEGLHSKFPQLDTFIEQLIDGISTKCGPRMHPGQTPPGPENVNTCHVYLRVVREDGTVKTPCLEIEPRQVVPSSQLPTESKDYDVKRRYWNSDFKPLFDTINVTKTDRGRTCSATFEMSIFLCDDKNFERGDIRKTKFGGGIMLSLDGFIIKCTDEQMSELVQLSGVFKTGKAGQNMTKFRHILLCLETGLGSEWSTDGEVIFTPFSAEMAGLKADKGNFTLQYPLMKEIAESSAFQQLMKWFDQQNKGNGGNDPKDEIEWFDELYEKHGKEVEKAINENILPAGLQISFGVTNHAGKDLFRFDPKSNELLINVGSEPHWDGITNDLNQSGRETFGFKILSYNYDVLNSLSNNKFSSFGDMWQASKLGKGTKKRKLFTTDVK